MCKKVGHPAMSLNIQGMGSYTCLRVGCVELALVTPSRFEDSEDESRELGSFFY